MVEEVDVLEKITYLEKRIHHFGSKRKYHVKEIKELQKLIIELEEHKENRT